MILYQGIQIKGRKSTIFPIQYYSPRSNFDEGQQGIMGPCSLREEISMPGGCLVESMHLIYEGVCKVFSYFIFKQRKLPCYLCN